MIGTIDAKELNVAMRYDFHVKILKVCHLQWPCNFKTDIFSWQGPWVWDDRRGIIWFIYIFGLLGINSIWYIRACISERRSIVSFQQINQMIADVDKDGSGAIEYDEFEHMMTAKIGERDTREELMKAFHIIDQDQNVKFDSVTHDLCIFFLILIV